MLFSHDTERSLACIVYLVNSAPSSGTPDLLGDVDALAAFVVRHDVSDVGELPFADGSLDAAVWASNELP